MTFGETIRALRKSHGLTQQAVATALEVDVTYISKIENDHLRGGPSDDLIVRMAQLFGVPAEPLLDLAGGFDAQQLRASIRACREYGVLIRRIQTRNVPRDLVARVLQELEEHS